MLHIAICDDEKDFVQYLTDLLNQYSKETGRDIKITPYYDGMELIEKYDTTIDLIFLDIYMDQDNGMDVAVRIREAGDSCSLIFVTSSDAFAVASYDVQAAYYLLKPLDTAKLMKVLDTIQIKNAQDVRYIEVICDRTPVRVPVKTILYADTFHNAVQLHTDAGVLRTYLTFQKFEELIQDLPCFLSCYRGCLVNMDRIHKTLEDSFLLDNQEVVQIRKRGANAIKKEYLNYLFS